MENLKDLISKVNRENPTEFDLRVISLTEFYKGLKKDKNMKALRRLKLLLYLYPTLVYKNSFRNIESIVLDPSGKKLSIRDRKEFSPLEIHLLKKNYGEIPENRYAVVFRVSDLYEYFGLGD